MNDFLNSLKADLLDRRLLPFAGVALAALVAAIAYVALGTGSGSSTPAGAGVGPAAVGPGSNGLSVSVANTTSDKAVAETTDGVKTQRKGSARNPFTPLGGASTTALTSGTSTSAGSGTSSSGGGGESTTPETTTPAKEETTKTKKPKTVYKVTVEFGSLKPDPVTNEVVLTPFVNLKLFTPLPSSQQPLLVFRGVTAGGKAATFTIVGEAILNGNGACLPSAFQCHALDLKVGQAEQLEYLAPGATTVESYELKVISITKAAQKAGAARAARVGLSDAAWGKVNAGWEILHKAGLLAIPYLHQSSQTGVLVFAPRHAARAHVSAHGPRLEG